mgnify:CR=1 FL=1
MEYIIIDTQEVVSQGELRRRNPDTSFPAVWGPDVLEFLGVAVVFPAPQPEFDSVSQSIIQGAPVLTDKGHYEQSWTIVDLDPEIVQVNQAAKLEQLKTSIVSIVQSNLDAFAQEKGYDGILSACSYASSSNATFKAEGLKAVELRDASWATLYSILADVEAGKRTVTSFADIETELPVLKW